MSFPTVRRALVSVSDKTGLVPFAKGLVSLGIELISSGGTYALLKDHVPVKEVSAFTGFPEMMEGRVKTLHPKVHGGILAKRSEHAEDIQKHGISLIDLVVCNLYPFEKTIAKASVSLEEAFANIDIGGPAMVRAAAKNYLWVGIVSSPGDYDAVLAELHQHQGALTEKTRYSLCVKAFQHTAHYDSVIAAYLTRQLHTTETPFPEKLHLSLEKKQDLRYGENPHQQAALYTQAPLLRDSVVHAAQLQGKSLSFNNLVDADHAFMCVRQFTHPSCVIVKHANPCGVASADTLLQAYQHAFESDPQSAFGGIIALNRALEANLLETILEKQFVELILAPTISKEALSLAKKKPQLRLLALGKENCGPAVKSMVDYKRLFGGLLVQTADEQPLHTDYRLVTEHAPSPEQKDSLTFANRVCRSVKSNAIVLVQGTRTIGIGAGQTSRVFSLTAALDRAEMAGFPTKGATLASDAFFPFTDSLEHAHQAGISAIIQPGGSIRDNEVIAKANELHIAMVFTGIRHFKH